MHNDTDAIITLNRADDRFPSELRRVHEPPKQLYCRGNLELLARAYVRFAVVGARKMTAYGAQVTRLVVPRLATPATVVVSGLALGVDAEAHASALDAGIPTLAVLGGGIDPGTVYPRANARLAERILAADGLLVSEYPPGTEPRPYHFPERNRIIAALSKAIVVIEAAARSGTSITARMALDAGRDVFAVPGSILMPTCLGTNTLIAAGAIPVCAPDDILDYYGLARSARGSGGGADLSPVQTSILEALRSGAESADELCERTGEAASQIMAELTVLELTGRIVADGERFVAIDNLSA